jgi:glycosyltransferase involved in cell wall biosynthesis
MFDLCIDARMINFSGIGTYLRELLVFIIPEFSTVLLGNKNELGNFLKKNNLSSEIIEFNSKIYSISEQIKYPFIIPKCRVYWSPHYNIPLMPIKAKKRLTTIHDLNHIVLSKSLRFIERLYAGFVMKRAVKLSNKIITVSKFSVSEIEKYYKEQEKINLIFNGINVKNFISDKDSTEYNLPDEYVLYVGNIKPHKNIKGAVESFNIYKKKYKSELKLVIVGKKEGLINAEDILYNENILFLENVGFSDLVGIYRRAKIFLFLSFYEGFGLPILEAQASGVPVICSNRGSLIEVSNGSCIEVDPNSYEDVANILNDLLVNSSLYSNYVKKGFNNIKKFPWNISADKHMQLIKSLLK